MHAVTSVVMPVSVVEAQGRPAALQVAELYQISKVGWPGRCRLDRGVRQRLPAADAATVLR
jgi:hypothetical protein